MLAKAVIDNDLLLAVNPEIAGFGWGNMSLSDERFAGGHRVSSGR